ncbi:Fyve finger-containing protein [Globisporangium polare]
MDDLNHRPSSAPSSSHRSNSVDDIFAEFERPNDYVFDPETGGYVSASAPKRTQRQQTKKRDLTPQFSQQEPEALMQSRELSLGHYDQSERRPATAESEDDDGLDNTIVDKISSLEGELAALKQLIRKRKSHDHPPSASRHVGINFANEQSSRKLSIFDHDSSDEDVPVRKTSSKKSVKSKSDVKMSPIKASKKSQKKTTKRRDSFADLFEDSPSEDSALGGGKSYESLFRTGSGKESGSDDDEAQQRQLRDELSKHSAGSRKGRKGAQEDSDSDGGGYSSLKASAGNSTRSVDDDEEYPSLKNRGKNAVQRRNTKKPAFRSELSSDEEEKPVSLAKTPKKPAEPKQVAAKKLTKPSRDEFDPIDALFDSSSERDVNNFFDIGDERKAVASSARDVGARAPDAKESKHVEGAKSSDEVPQYEGPASEEDADSDEDFAASLAKAKKRRSQRGSLAPAAVTVFDDSAVEGKKEELDSVDNSAVDSDEEFALTLKKGRAGATNLSSSDAEPVRMSSAAMESTTPVQSASQDQADVNEIVVDEELAFSVTATKASRGKTVSFFDQAALETESSESTVDIFGKVLESAGAAEESVQVADAAQDDAVDSVEGMEFSMPLPGTSSDGENEAIDEVVLKPPAESDGVQESTQNSIDALESPRTSEEEHETALMSPVEVIEAKLNHVLGHTAEVTTSADARLVANTDASTSLPRDNVELSNLFEDDSLGMFSQSTDVYSASLGSSLIAGDGSEEESDGEGAHAEEDSFSFEVKPKKRSTQAPVHFIPTELPKRRPVEDDDEALVLGKYSSAPPSQQFSPTERSADPESSKSVAASYQATPPEAGDLSQPELLSEAQVDTDWQQMQEQEKERKKKLQLKQRQAQRDKLLKKQGASSKQMNASSSSVGNTSGSSSTGEKKKKKKSDPATPRKKSSSSKKHKHKPIAEDPEGEQGKENVDSGSISTLTEL